MTATPEPKPCVQAALFEFEESALGKGSVPTNQCTTETNVNFQLQPTNLNVSGEISQDKWQLLAAKGHGFDGHHGAFTRDIVFSTDVNNPGFVVQHVQKDLRVSITGGQERTRMNYWEIFYINSKGRAHSPDCFKQQPCPQSVSGEGCIIGVAYFYPYPDDVKVHNGAIVATHKLRQLFGEGVYFREDATPVYHAGGLPSSPRRPTMSGLCAEPGRWVHKVTFTWTRSSRWYSRTRVTETTWKNGISVELTRRDPFTAKDKDLTSLFSQIFPTAHSRSLRAKAAMLQTTVEKAYHYQERSNRLPFDQ